MELFELINNRALPSVHALMIKPFKGMWERDTSRNNEDCIRDFSYIELMCNPRKSNPFSGLAEEKRSKVVLKEVYGDENHVVHSDIILGMMIYKDLLQQAAPSYSLYQGALRASAILEGFLNTFDMTSTTNSGALKLKPADVANAIAKIPSAMKEVEILKTKVQQELFEDTKTKKAREIGPFER